MWLLPTRGRPELCQATLDACEATGMTSPGLVIADPTRRRQYADIHLPENWAMIEKHMNLQPVKNWFLRENPKLSFYGLIFDDMIPKTDEWDRRYEEEAGEWYMVGCEDEFRSTSVASDGMPSDFAGAMGWGGELIRAVGWWGPPWAMRACGDDAWLLIARNAGVRRHLKDVTIEHRNWKTGKRKHDGTDEWVRDGINQVEADFNGLRIWQAQGGLAEAVERVKEKMNGG